ncbi:MAG: 2-hydroxy-3-oxopropionate reductase, partial [Rhodospirillales bacterium]|nr:2-hydroxy-3-oxopropionate reductase [Rhodospirillales bacterium]
MASLGWIGMGRIGTPMALRLIAAGHRLTVWDSAPEQLAPAIAHGAIAASCGAATAIGTEAVLLCVSDTNAVEEAVFGPDGVAAAGLIVDHTTIHPDQCRAMAERLRSTHGTGWVDAPISGGPRAAADGLLTVWLGGDRTDADRARQWIECYGRKISYMGSSGRGQIAKSCNQAIVASTVAIWAEMLAYAAQCGLDPSELVDTLEGSGADSGTRRTFANGLAKGEFPALSSRNMIKDLSIVADLARAHNAEMPIAQLA